MTEKERDVKRVNARLTAELYSQFAKAAEKRGLSIQASAVIAIENYVKEVLGNQKN